MSGAVTATTVADASLLAGAGIGAGATIGAAGTVVGTGLATGAAAGLGATALGVLNSPVGAAAAGSVVSSVLGGLNKPRVPAAPALSTTLPTVPLPDQQNVLDAQKRQIAIQTANQGRAGTVLTTPAKQTLG